MFEYPCPGCRTRNNLHESGCRFDGTPWHEIEAAYADVLAPLAAAPRSEQALRDLTDWGALRAACLNTLEDDYRVERTDRGLALVPPERRKEELSVPPNDPLRTVYDEGSVPGCHDNAVFALVAWYESVGFSWEETRERVVEWLRESGAWDRGGFEEPSPGALLDEKRHVYESGYGWRQAAQAAKGVIERRG
jgi:hypothetical protein